MEEGYRLGGKPLLGYGGWRGAFLADCGDVGT